MMSISAWWVLVDKMDVMMQCKILVLVGTRFSIYLRISTMFLSTSYSTIIKIELVRTSIPTEKKLPFLQLTQMLRFMRIGRLFPSNLGFSGSMFVGGMVNSRCKWSLWWYCTKLQDYPSSISEIMSIWIIIRRAIVIFWRHGLLSNKGDVHFPRVF